jgi:hypothetical protein
MEATVGAEVFRAAEAEWQAIARETPVWEAEVVPVPVHLGEDRETAPALVMVAAAGYVVHGDALPRRPAGAAERAQVIVAALSAAAGDVGVWPGRLRVRDEALAAALAEELAPREVAVETGAMPELDEALDASLEHLCESATLARFTVPARWAETEAPAEALADFHRAAAEFHAAEPWKDMDTGEPLALTFPDGSEWGVSVLGAGEERGITMYSDPDDLLDLLEMSEEDARDDEEMDRMIAEMRGHWLTVELAPRGRLSRPMVREIAAAGWPVADASAYPVIIGGWLPERRVTAEHVARATLALRAVTLAARGVDPEPETGVRLSLLMSPPLWTVPEIASPICAEGPGAAPERVLSGPDADEDEARREGAEWLARFDAWLPKHPTRKEDLLNARAWSEFLVVQAIPASAATEFDLRIFLYAFYPHEAGASEVAASLLPQSLHQLFRFLEEREGIRYPFADRVLGELEKLEEEIGAPLEELLEDASHEVYDDLHARAMLPALDLADETEWPVEADSEVLLLLRYQLQRRWLLWYDELVRAGTTDFEELEDSLLIRQREWEAAPNPAAGGRTPAEAVHAYLATHANSEEDAG